MNDSHRSNSQIAELIFKDLLQQITDSEKAELELWVSASDENRAQYHEMVERSRLQLKLEEFNNVNTEGIWEKISKDVTGAGATLITIPGRRYKWMKLTAAAAVVSTIGFCSWFFFIHNPKKKAEKNIVAVPVNDVAPGGNKAVLTLADNSQIILDEAKDGSLAQQGSTAIFKQEGQLSYQTDKSTNTKEGLYNTLSTPRGGQFHLVLPDGSHAWLNAASTIHFPVAFAGTERRVTITGEAYFEIAHNKNKPFIVSVLPSTGGRDRTAEVEVLGTHFNINAYTDEPSIKTTLLEGKVRISVPLSSTEQAKSQPALILKPGQQAQVNEAQTIKLIPDANTTAVVAWKNGAFNFESSIHTVMRQIARWYDVDIVYQGSVPDHEFVGQVSRYSNVSKVLELLEMTGGVHFKIEGKKIIVMK